MKYKYLKSVQLISGSVANHYYLKRKYIIIFMKLIIILIEISFRLCW